MQPPRRGRRDNGNAKIKPRDTTHASLPQQAPIPKPESGGLHPYAFRLKDGKGIGVYLTPVPSLNAARAELLNRWPNELLSVKRGA